jgi:hypothetical protein
MSQMGTSGLMQCSKRILFDHLVGATKQRDWECEAERLRDPEVMYSPNSVGCCTAARARSGALDIPTIIQADVLPLTPPERLKRLTRAPEALGETP